jgi:3,4-dihydroxy 2-butanone 4-phosphate synthase / GTP cyclohydrolase II
VDLNLQEIASRTNRTIEEVQHLIDKAKQSMIPLGKQVSVTENGLTRFFIVTRQGVGLIKTDFGRFHQFDFGIDDAWIKYSVLFFGTLDDNLMPIFAHQELLLMRIDSGCETGQLFGDRTCECREQLALAMKTVAEHGEGLIVNIPRQDGRGLGLLFKLATLRLQDELKLNTVEAANAVAPNGVIDIRTYGGVIGILKYIGVSPATKINLATNNPHKAGVFAANGYAVADYTPIVIPPTDLTREHLEAKQEHLGHIGLVQPKEGDQDEDILPEPGTAPPSSDTK